MGVYPAKCPQCGQIHQWFSGNTGDQRCGECRKADQPAKAREWLIAEGTEYTEPSVLPSDFELFPGWKDSHYIHVVEFSALAKCQAELDAANARIAEIKQTLDGLTRSPIEVQLALLCLRLYALDEERIIGPDIAHETVNLLLSAQQPHS